MVASRQVEILLYGGIVRQRGGRFGALAHVIGITAILFPYDYIVPAAKRVGIDLMEFDVQEIAVVSSRKKLKKAEENVGRQTLRKQLGSGSRNGRSTNRVFPTKSETQTSWSHREFLNFSH